MSRPLYVVASVIVAGAIVLSALSLMDVGARASERRTAAYPGVATLRVEAASGDARAQLPLERRLPRLEAPDEDELRPAPASPPT